MRTDTCRFQAGGNFFIARNAITNYVLEALQFNAGPNSAVGNTFDTLISDGSACAVCAGGTTQVGLTGTSNDYATCFVGNWVYGGRHGEKWGNDFVSSFVPFTLNFSGNYLNLFPPFDEFGDVPASAVTLGQCQTVSICGNRMVSGGRGLTYGTYCSSALVLMNDFSSAAYCGIGFQNSSDFLVTASVFNNILGEGVSFHAQFEQTNSFGWFFKGNQYLNGSTNVSPFFDPASSSAHLSN